MNIAFNKTIIMTTLMIYRLPENAIDKPRLPPHPGSQTTRPPDMQKCGVSVIHHENGNEERNQVIESHGRDRQTKSRVDNSRTEMPLCDVTSGLVISESPDKSSEHETSLAHDTSNCDTSVIVEGVGNSKGSEHEGSCQETQAEAIKPVESKPDNQYEKLSSELTTDQKYLKEITLGKRIG